MNIETIRDEERAENDRTRTVMGVCLYELAYALTEWEDPDDE